MPTRDPQNWVRYVYIVDDDVPFPVSAAGQHLDIQTGSKVGVLALVGGTGPVKFQAKLTRSPGMVVHTKHLRYLRHIRKLPGAP